MFDYRRPSIETHGFKSKLPCMKAMDTSNFFLSFQMSTIKIIVHVSQHCRAGSRKCVTKMFRKHVADSRCSINSNQYFGVDNYTVVIVLLFFSPFSLHVSFLFSLWNFLSPCFSYPLISLNRIYSQYSLSRQALSMTQTC